MSKINILPKSLADLIAAGEVVERPASVVKELLENSVDAGSKNITVEIFGGGIKYIRITDDGCGIDAEDIRAAFISHATSKIATEDDLFNIYTLGFRGEALASVAAVAKVDVLTRTHDSESGTHYCIEGGEEIELAEAGCPEGTTIVVSDLFYNTPARMNFLKKDVSEANAVSDVVDRIALSHPEIAVRFIRDGKQVLVTSGNGDLSSAAYSVFGNDFAKALIPVSYKLEGVEIDGFISKPSSCRASRSMQFFYLNGRYIKSKNIIAALEASYKNSVMVGKFPSCILNIKIDASFVDVNVHPTKTEVRFSDERKIFNVVYYACVNSLELYDTRVQADLTSSVRKAAQKAPQRAMPQYSQVRMEQRPKKDFWQNLTGEDFKGVSEKITSKTSDGNVKVTLHDSVQKPVVSDIINEEKSYLSEFYQKKAQTEKTDTQAVTQPETEQKTVKKDDPEQISPPEEPQETVKLTAEEIRDLPEVKILGEAFKTYIIAQVGDRLVIVDKHAAHERIIFNKLKQREMSSQYLFTPVTVTLNKTEYSALLENIELLSKAGYAVEDFGIGTVIVRECPCEISLSDIPSQITEIASYLVEKNTDIETEKIDWIYHSAACRAAVKAGSSMHPYEQQKFVEMLLSDDSVRYCPHGRPVLIEMTKNELEKQFGRIQ
ncbi:MAG: DNA mismatch repair endonuclease MutL [Acutalibacteraceae bacterium]